MDKLEIKNIVVKENSNKPKKLTMKQIFVLPKKCKCKGKKKCNLPK